jgi:F-type H+-transporting ATPase subunit b
MIEINLPIMLVQMATFIIAVFVLWKSCWKAVCGMLQERKVRIQKDMEVIEQTRQSVEAMRREYENKLAAVQAEAEGIRAAAKREALADKNAMLKAAHDEIADMRRKNDILMKTEYRELLRELYDEVSDLTVLLTEKIVAKSATRELHDKVFKETIQELEKVF